MVSLLFTFFSHLLVVSDESAGQRNGDRQNFLLY
jgi:hypothetical protein